MGIEFELKSTATSAALNKLARQIGDRRQVNYQLAVQMSSWVDRNFLAEGRLNEPWASLAPSTAARRVTKSGERRGFEHILVSIGQGGGLLRASFQRFGYDNDSATVGSAITYSQFHEEGGPNLPRRPMLPTKAIALRDAVDVYGLWLHKGIQGAGLK